MPKETGAYFKAHWEPKIIKIMSFLSEIWHSVKALERERGENHPESVMRSSPRHPQHVKSSRQAF